MTIQIGAARRAVLVAAGTENNPVIGALGVEATATITTANGTELEAAANLATKSTYDFWRVTPTGTGSASAQYVFAATVSLDFVGIAAHNIGSAGATVKVQYSLDSGATWNTVGASAVSPADDGAIAFRFTAVSADYWRIRITSAGTTNIRIGVATLCNEIILTQRIYQGYTPPITQTRVDLQSNVSEGAHLLGSSVVRKSSSTSAALKNIAPGFLRATRWMDFQKAYNSGDGFFWGWRPEKYGDLFYGWRAGPPLVPTNSGPADLMSFEMQMRFYDDP